MTDQLISFETAKLAKEKKFVEKVRFHYYDNGIKPFLEDNLKAEYPTTSTGEWNANMNVAHNGGIIELYSAPTQSLLADWLLEKHDIFIYVKVFRDTKLGVTTFVADSINLTTGKTKRILPQDDIRKARELGLMEALLLIK